MIVDILLKIIPFGDAEILSAALTCFFMTLFGLSLGFVLLKVQGD